MSAFVVSRDHIWYLVHSAMDPHLMTCQGAGIRWYRDGKERGRLLAGQYDIAAALGQMLWDENMASVRHRYSDDPESMMPDDTSYGDHEGRPFGAEVDPVQTLKAIRCYEYQSCEHPGWDQSDAKAFCESLTLRAIAALPGYDDAAWSIDSIDSRGRAA